MRKTHSKLIDKCIRHKFDEEYISILSNESYSVKLLDNLYSLISNQIYCGVKKEVTLDYVSYVLDMYEEQGQTQEGNYKISVLMNMYALSGYYYREKYIVTKEDKALLTSCFTLSDEEKRWIAQANFSSIEPNKQKVLLKEFIILCSYHVPKNNIISIMKYRMNEDTNDYYRDICNFETGELVYRYLCINFPRITKEILEDLKEDNQEKTLYQLIIEHKIAMDFDLCKKIKTLTKLKRTKEQIIHELDIQTSFGNKEAVYTINPYKEAIKKGWALDDTNNVIHYDKMITPELMDTLPDCEMILKVPAYTAQAYFKNTGVLNINFNSFGSVFIKKGEVGEHGYINGKRVSPIEWKEYKKFLITIFDRTSFYMKARGNYVPLSFKKLMMSDNPFIKDLMRLIIEENKEEYPFFEKVEEFLKDRDYLSLPITVNDCFRVNTWEEFFLTYKVANEVPLDYNKMNPLFSYLTLKAYPYLSKESIDLLCNGTDDSFVDALCFEGKAKEQVDTFIVYYYMNKFQAELKKREEQDRHIAKDEDANLELERDIYDYASLSYYFREKISLELNSIEELYTVINGLKERFLQLKKFRKNPKVSFCDWKLTQHMK